ncbi:MAG: dihydroorotate dehydrogenase (quinone), partial [Erythrobacter sp.]|nr:dihydroorotate dehydrogenase (quinone) [Erythrobacter sp.]
MIFRLARPALFALDSEKGHRLAIAGLKALPSRGANSSLAQPGAAQIRVAGLDFPNPVGVAAGFDKDA